VKPHDELRTAPESLQVVRGMAVQALPHLLRRPKRDLSAARNAAPAESESRSFEDGLAEGLQRGLAQGGELAALQFMREQQAEIMAAHAEALEHGRAEGLRAGRAQAEREALQSQDIFNASAKQTLEQRMARLDELIVSASLAIANASALAEDDLVALAYEAGCAVVGAAAFTREGVASQVARLVANHGHKKSLRIHLHPDDVAALLELNPAWLAHENVSLIADSRMETGGVQLRSSEGSLDARLDTQLQAWRDSMQALRRERMKAD